MKNRLISIIIPCYNEEKVLHKLFIELDKSLKKLESIYNFEILLINDGSKDLSLNIIKEKCEKTTNYKFISFSRNFGHQIAVSCGLKHSKGDAVIIIDADLQDPPEIIEEYLKKWEKGFEVVYAIRKKRKENLFKKSLYWLFYRFLNKLIDFEIPLDSGDFSLIDRKVVDILNSMPEKNRFVRGLRAWAGFKQIGVSYERGRRAAGESKYTFKKLLKLASDGIFSFSTLPLTIAIRIGLFIFILSLFGIIFTFFQRFFYDYFNSIGLAPSPGFATIVISILFLGGIQIFFLGIIGCYIIRIYDEVKRRPNWIIDDFKGFNEKDISNFN